MGLSTPAFFRRPLMHSLRRALFLDQAREYCAIAVGELARIAVRHEMQLECADGGRRIDRVVAERGKQRQTVGLRRHAVRRIAPQAVAARRELAPRKRRPGSTLRRGATSL